MDKGEKILKIIENLETLEKVKKQYSKEIDRRRFWQSDSLDSSWSKTGQLFVNEIEIDLVELWDCILVNTQWSKEGIECAIRTREPDRMGRLIHEFNLIRGRLEFESQPEQSKPAETELQGVNMIKPTVGIMSEIIEKIEDLRAKVSTFLSIKLDAPSVEPVGKSVDECAEEIPGCAGLSTEELYGAVIMAAIKGVDMSPELVGKLNYVPSRDELLGGFEIYFINSIPALPTRRLQELLEQVIPQLYKGDEIPITDGQGMRTKEGKRLDGLRDAVSRELKCREQKKEVSAKVRAISQKFKNGKNLLDTIREARNEIRVSMCPYMDYFTVKDSWGNDERRTIETVIRCKDTRLLDELIVELKIIKHKMEVEAKPEQLKQGGTGREAKKTKKAKKLEKKYKPWTDSGDACFVIENNRIKFHYKNETEDLKLKSESKTHRLLLLIRSGSLRPGEIKADICPNTTNKASKVVDYANKLLNEKIAEVGFVGVPPNVEFIERDKYGHYSASKKIYEKEEFENMQLQSN